MELFSGREKFFTQKWRPYVILFLLGCIFYLPGITHLPPTDRDEARFAQASRQMLETGNYIDIRFQSKPRYKKPIGIYWLQAASDAIFGDPESPKIWPYRLPSFLGALITVLLTFYLGKPFFNPRVGFLAALLLESSVLLQVEATIATTDASLLATITAMMVMLGRIYLSENERTDMAVWGFWIFCGVGVLLKGPIPPFVAFLTVITLSILDKNLKLVRRLRPLPGIFLLLIVVLPWFWAIHKATGGTFIRKALTQDLLPKLLGGHESHGAPPGLYLLLIPLLFWPGTLVFINAMKEAWRSKSERTIRFLISWAIPTWLAFEFIPTKLPHYILPVFPALSILTGFYLIKAGVQGDAWFNKAKGFTNFISKWIFIGITLSICLGDVALGIYFNHTVSIAASLVVLGGALLTWLVFRPHHLSWTQSIVAICVISGTLITMPTFSFVLPSANPIWISREVSRAISQIPELTKPALASVGYHEPSLVFLAGTKTRIGSLQEVLKSLEERKVTHVLVPKKLHQLLLQEALKRGIKLRLIKQIHGFNYSKGKWLNLNLYRVTLH